jgi:uncharacterized protein YciI
VSDAMELPFPVVPYFLVLLSPGENAAAAPNYFEAHIAFIDAMAAANIVLLGGEFESAIDGATGAYLLRVSTRADAEAWAAKDPLISHGAYRARIVTWHLVGITPGAIDPAFIGS